MPGSEPVTRYRAEVIVQAVCDDEDPLGADLVLVPAAMMDASRQRS
jgi:hypothetical protein